MKFNNQTWIENNEGVRKDIIVKGLPMAIKLSKKEFNKEIIIGSTLFIIGGILITRGAFRNGSRAFELAEYETMESLGLFK